MTTRRVVHFLPTWPAPRQAKVPLRRAELHQSVKCIIEHLQVLVSRDAGDRLLMLEHFAAELRKGL